MKIGFVILHYNAIQETIDCVKSIEEKLDTKDFHIVIVDNASPNGTGKKLEEMYSSAANIKVICNEANLGFAGGNNIGYKYAKETLSCEFVCVMNNDTLIIQDDFYSTIQKEYEDSKFGVLGPRIVLKDGKDNGLYVKLPSLEFMREELKLNKRNIFLMKWHLDHFVTAFKMARNYVYKILHKPKVSRYGQYFSAKGTDERHSDIILHGCCLVFSPAYEEYYEDAFNPDTFLYREEDILYLRCKKVGLPMIYSPKLLIKHLEDASTETVVKKSREKIVFQMKHQVNSLGVLINEMENM